MVMATIPHLLLIMTADIITAVTTMADIMTAAKLSALEMKDIDLKESGTDLKKKEDVLMFNAISRSTGRPLTSRLLCKEFRIVLQDFPKDQNAAMKKEKEAAEI
jgi:hypothetical protein